MEWGGGAVAPGADLGTAFPATAASCSCWSCRPGARRRLSQRSAGRVRAHAGTSARAGRAPPRLPAEGQGARRGGPAVLLPQVRRPRMGACRRRRPLQGSGDRPGDPRRAALRPAIGRARRTGARTTPAARRGLARWERERDRGCLETYQWTNLWRGDGARSRPSCTGHGPPSGAGTRAARCLLALPAAEVLTLRRSARFAFRAGAPEPTAPSCCVAGRELRIDFRHRLQRMRLAR